MPAPPAPEQRAQLLSGAVRHVLAHGIGTLSLRPLAAELGTSDRMLIYYFGTRQALLVAVLDDVGRRLRTTLDAALPAKTVSAAALLVAARDLLDNSDVEPYLRLYVEVSGLAAAGREPFRAAAASIAEGWMTWTAVRLDAGPAATRDAAAGVLAVIDGLLLIRFILGADHADGAHRWLASTLARSDG
jgi:AcrR family transcriptional regulator